MTSTVLSLILALTVLAYLAYRLRQLRIIADMNRPQPLVERRRSRGRDRRSGQDRRAVSRGGPTAGRRSRERRYDTSRLRELNGLS